jgi:hypothetical protein
MLNNFGLSVQNKYQKGPGKPSPRLHRSKRQEDVGVNSPRDFQKVTSAWSKFEKRQKARSNLGVIIGEKIFDILLKFLNQLSAFQFGVKCFGKSRSRWCHGRFLRPLEAS